MTDTPSEEDVEVVLPLRRAWQHFTRNDIVPILTRYGMSSYGAHDAADQIVQALLSRGYRLPEEK